MKRTWPIIGVKDVAVSTAWYQALLGQEKTPSTHDDFAIIQDDDGTKLLGLHEWGGHDEGPPLAAASGANDTNGILLSILVEDFEQCLGRARAMDAPFAEEPERPEDWFSSFKLRDPDGYYVSIYSMQELKALEAKSGA